MQSQKSSLIDLFCLQAQNEMQLEGVRQKLCRECHDWTVVDAFIQMSGGEYQIPTGQALEYLQEELKIDSEKIGDDLGLALRKVVSCEEGLSLERFIDLFSPVSAEIKE